MSDRLHRSHTHLSGKRGAGSWWRRGLAVIAMAAIVLPAATSAARLPLGLSTPTVALAANDTVSVCSEGSTYNPVPGTLRYVVARAARGDTINFSCTGTITLSSGGGGPIDINKALTIDGAGQITIAGDSSTSLFTVDPTGALTIDNLTLSGGKTDPVTVARWTTWHADRRQQHPLRQLGLR